MKTTIDYQYMPKDSERPIDNGEVVGIDATDEDGTVVVPDVGDFVQIDSSTVGAEHNSFEGKVRSRLFRYIVTPEGTYCHVNIIVADSDDYDPGQLIKE